MNRYSFPSPFGNILIEENNNELVSLKFNKTSLNFNDKSPVIKLTIQQLREYFNAKRTNFDLPLNILGTDFQKSVWKKVSKVPYGKTKSYSEISKQLENPGAIRAIGAANGKNNFHIIIPCHRIIGADGSLTGYAGGLDVKKQLLELEGALNTKQTSLF